MMSEDPNQGSVRLGMAATTRGGGGDEVPTRRRAGEPNYHPNETLASAIVRAWSDEDFRNRLLTYPTNNMRAPNYENTRGALREIGVGIDNPMIPVVLTPQQYVSYRRRANQIIFVLPDPLGSMHNLATAQVAMSVTNRGM
jgi:hypothetical protein